MCIARNELLAVTFAVFISADIFCVDEFKGHSLLQAAREADMAKAKRSLALEIINFKHPHTHETALVRPAAIALHPLILIALPVC